MATLLYEELGIQSAATPEDIRKAYKKKALLTHPDRLPPTATVEQKKEAEEKFRKVNHAYEILTDTEKRKEYDFHGVWPAPEEEAPMPTRRSSQSRPFHADPLFAHHHHHHHQHDFNSFAFTDPFALFDSIFGDLRGHRTNNFGFGYQASFEFERELESTFPFWASESHMTQSINGLTQTIKKQRDMAGNEHITRTFADGRQFYTINGMEQPPRDRLPGADQQTAPRQTSHRLPPKPSSTPPPYSSSNVQNYPAGHWCSTTLQPMAPVIFPPTVFPHEHDRRYRDNNYDSRRSRGSQHQNHLQCTHHKSPNLRHPNPSPYYRDDIDRPCKHHHFWNRR